MADRTGRVATDEGLIARDDAKVLASNDWLNDFFTHFDGEESPFDIAAAFDVGTGTFASGIQEKPVGVTSKAGEECPKKRNAEDRKSTRLKLQSHSDLVCRLLLEKKNNKKNK